VLAIVFASLWASIANYIKHDWDVKRDAWHMQRGFGWAYLAWVRLVGGPGR